MSNNDSEGEWFSVSFDVICTIVSIQNNELGGRKAMAEEILAYLCLCRGAGRYSSSGWTENAISEYADMTHGRAVQACTFLKQHGFIELNPNHRAVKQNTENQLVSVIEPETTFETAKKSLDARHKYSLPNHLTGTVINLPNQIVDGADRGKKSYPLARFAKRIGPQIENSITSRDARLDAIFLLLCLYTKQDLATEGGVSISTWSRSWPAVNDGGGLGGSDALTEIAESKYCLYEVEKGDKDFQIESLLDDFSYIDNEEMRSERIHFALSNLLKMHFVYEVLQVWATDDPDYESGLDLQYPLYVSDRSQQKNDEPALARSVNELAFLVYPSNEVFPINKKFDIGSGKQFRFIGDGNLFNFLLSSLRLRYRPHNRDCGRGMGEQAGMVENWTTLINSLKTPVREYYYDY